MNLPVRPPVAVIPLQDRIANAQMNAYKMAAELFNQMAENVRLESDNLCNQKLLDECKQQLEYFNKRFGPFQNTTNLIKRL